MSWSMWLKYSKQTYDPGTVTLFRIFTHPGTQWLCVCSIYPQASLWHPVIYFCFILTSLCNSLWLFQCSGFAIHSNASQTHISGSQHTSSFSPSVLSRRHLTFPHQCEPCQFSMTLWPDFITTMNFTWESSFKLQKRHTTILQVFMPLR